MREHFETGVQSAGRLRLLERCNQVGERAVVDAAAALRRGDGETDRQLRLPDAGRRLERIACSRRLFRSWICAASNCSIASGPVQTWMAALTDSDRERALTEIHDALRQYYDGRSVNVPIDVIVASGQRSA